MAINEAINQAISEATNEAINQAINEATNQVILPKTDNSQWNPCLKPDPYRTPKDTLKIESTKKQPNKHLKTAPERNQNAKWKITANRHLDSDATLKQYGVDTDRLPTGCTMAAAIVTMARAIITMAAAIATMSDASVIIVAAIVTMAAAMVTLAMVAVVAAVVGRGGRRR